MRIRDLLYPGSSALDEKDPIFLFCDESSQSGHPYLAIGMLAVEIADAPDLLAELAESRARNRQRHEMKWKLVNDGNFDGYADWIDIFDRFVKKELVYFAALVAEAGQMDNRRNNGDPDLGFSKLLYQLLLHRAGRRYGRTNPLHGYLDSRSTKHQPHELKSMLNAGLKKSWKVTTGPFRVLEFKDSRTSDIIQLVDVITGAIANSKNRRATRKAKAKLTDKVLKTFARPRQEWIWRFRYNEPK